MGARRIGIGSLSRRAGVHIETIRYYEREGLLPEPPRTPGGHRAYDEVHVRRLNFIRRGRELGFTLGEIRQLLALVDENDFTCDEVKELTLGQARRVRAKIADLRKIETVLRDMAARCDRGAVPECPVVDALFAADSPAAARP